MYKGYRTVVRSKFSLPNGEMADFDIVAEGKVVCVLAMTSDNRVILAKQFRPGPEKVLFELPGGGVAEHETPKHAAARELMEETGYVGEMEFVCESFHSAYSTLVRYNFVARNCQKMEEINNPDDHEFTEAVLMPLEDFKDHVRSGQLTDMGTAYRCLDYLGLV